MCIDNISEQLDPKILNLQNNFVLQYSQYSTVLYSTHSTLQYPTVLYSNQKNKQNSTVHYSTQQYSTVFTVLYSTLSP